MYDFRDTFMYNLRHLPTMCRTTTQFVLVFDLDSDPAEHICQTPYPLYSQSLALVKSYVLTYVHTCPRCGCEGGIKRLLNISLWAKVLVIQTGSS